MCWLRQEATGSAAGPWQAVGKVLPPPTARRIITVADHPISSRPVLESRSAPIWMKIIVAALSPRLCHAWRVPR
jgi:hypothetical protein